MNDTFEERGDDGRYLSTVEANRRVEEINRRLDLIYPGKGRKVRIPKGTVITGTFPERRKVAGRTYTVTAHHFDRGYTGDTHIPPESKHYIGPRPPRLCWVGAGGYWHYADFADVEVLPEEGGAADA